MAMVMRARKSSRVLVSCLMPSAVLSKVWATARARRPRSADSVAALSFLYWLSKEAREALEGARAGRGGCRCGDE